MNQVASATNQTAPGYGPRQWIRLGGAALLLLTAFGILAHLAWPVLGIAILIGSRWPRKDLRRSIPVIAVLVAATVGLAASALRWSTFDLAAITGAQGVLGPALLVGPPQATAATALGVGAVLLAVAFVLPPKTEWGRTGWALWAAELLGTGAVVALLCWGVAGAMGEMWLAALASAAVVGGLGWALARAPAFAGYASLGAAGICALAGAWIGLVRA